MRGTGTPTAVVVGSGPNGLVAALTLAADGFEVTVLEAADRLGGGTRSSELTLPGLIHDECSAAHPLALDTPFSRRFNLSEYGLVWRWPEIQYAHPLDGGRGAAAHRSLAETAAGLGADGGRWRALFEPLAERFGEIMGDFMSPLLTVPDHPLEFAEFGVRAAIPATVLARAFRTAEARALFGGVAAHAIQPMHLPLSSAIAMALGAAAHSYGWPVAEGGSGSVNAAIVAQLRTYGATLETGVTVTSLNELGDPDVVMLDVAPGAAVSICGERLPPRIARALARYRHGPGAFKVEFAVEGGVPWNYEPATRAGTLHLGGTFDEIAVKERQVVRGEMPDEPFVLVCQQYLADPTRSNGNVHPVYSYAHVPSGWSGDATPLIERQIERYAPGFTDRILARYVRSVADTVAYDANYVGGDILAGANSPRQLLFRPRPAVDPYSLGIPGVYICSAATPPGAGAHGMSGYNAAVSALRHVQPGVRRSIRLAAPRPLDTAATRGLGRPTRHRVVIVGSGFGGLAAARALARAPVELTVIDRRNFHLFQPLLYQVATGSLSPGEIASPLRGILKRQENTRVVMAEVVGLDLDERLVVLGSQPNKEHGASLPYDSLIVAAGARHSFFGNDRFEAFAPGMKTIEDALRIRRRMLMAFEAAELEDDPARRRAWLNFVVVGAGPTGVEVAGQIAEIANYTLRRDFRAIDPRDTRVMLVEAADRVLPPYVPQLSAKAQRSLERLGVIPLLGTMVTDMDWESVTVKTPAGRVETIPARTKVWAAGVEASPLARSLASGIGATVDRAGRITVNPDLTLPGHPEVFAIGDMNRVDDGAGGVQPWPGVAQTAIQEGRYASAVIVSRLTGIPSSSPFSYNDKGSLATIGRWHAVADIKGARFAGPPAWLAWLVIHLAALIGFENRLIVFTRWTLSFLGRSRGQRLMTGESVAADYEQAPSASGAGHLRDAVNVSV